MLCRIFLIALGVGYLAALFIYAGGPFGWLGAEWDQLSAVVLMIVGLPWVLFPLGPLIDQAYWPAVAVAAPLLNLAIIRVICRRLAD